MAFDKCCCCLSKRTSVITCTTILILAYLSGIYDDIKSILVVDYLMDILGFKNVYYILELIMTVLILITMIVLLIGIVKDRVPLMKPFNIIYLIYIIFKVIYNVYTLIKIRIAYNNITPEDVEKYNENVFSKIDINNLKATFQKTYTMSEFKDYLDQFFYYSILFILISLTINIIYYITTRNYIKSIEDEEKEIDGIKNMESAN